MANTAVGNPYVESSDLVANYPGVSETLAERIDVVGVNPFADAAARTTTIPSPVEGQMSSLSDTDSVDRYDGSAWVAVGVDPGLVHINTTTFSAVSSVSLDDVFTSTYANYKIIADFNPSTTANHLLRLRVGAADTTTNYQYQILYAGNTSVSGARTTTASSWSVLNSDVTAAVGFICELLNPQATLSTIGKVSYLRNAASTTIAFQDNVIGYTPTTSFDGLSLIAGSGTLTGTIRVYGYKNGA